MKIHHVETRYEEQWVFDPVNGPGRKTVAIYQPSSVGRIVHGGQTFEVQPDGAFELPEEVAGFFLRQPNWFRGLPPQPPEELETPRRGPRARKE